MAGISRVLRSCALCVLLGASSWALIAGLPIPARAQSSGRQTTPDGRQVLVNRPEAGLQWAISYSPNDGTITGNVFDPGGGDPTFIWCARVGDDGVMDPAAVEIQWHCEGAQSCNHSPCLSSNWADLGVVPLVGSFFLPAADPFVSLQPARTSCDPTGVGPVEEFVTPSWEVDTELCRYATMVQPSLTPIGEGEDLFVRVWRFNLESPPNGSAFFTLMIGDEVLYGEEMQIPQSSGLLGPFGVGEDGIGICVRPKREYPAGTQVAFNVQVRDPAPVAPAPSSVAQKIDAPDLARPLHNTPGVIHMLEMTVGSDCAGEPAGRRLTTYDRWTRVSRGVPAPP